MPTTSSCSTSDSTTKTTNNGEDSGDKSCEEAGNLKCLESYLDCRNIESSEAVDVCVKIFERCNKDVIHQCDPDRDSKEPPDYYDDPLVDPNDPCDIPEEGDCETQGNNECIKDYKRCIKSIANKKESTEEGCDISSDDDPDKCEKEKVECERLVQRICKSKILENSNK